MTSAIRQGGRQSGVLGTRSVVRAAWNNFRRGARSDLRGAFEKFLLAQAECLDGYALFDALKTRYNGAYYVEWPSDLVYREPSASARARNEMKDRIEQSAFAGFLFFRQAGRIKDYARSAEVRIIGHLPFFVSPNSSDACASPQFFDLDACQADFHWLAELAGTSQRALDALPPAGPPIAKRSPEEILLTVQ